VDFVLIGHSHYAFSKSNKYSTLINVGSVGQSRNQSGFAQWTLINSKTKVFEMRSTPYDATNLIAEVELQDPDNVYLKEVLNRS
jgi:predicted phosphodiesterase